MKIMIFWTPCDATSAGVIVILTKQKLRVKNVRGTSLYWLKQYKKHFFESALSFLTGHVARVDRSSNIEFYLTCIEWYNN